MTYRVYIYRMPLGKQRKGSKKVVKKTSRRKASKSASKKHSRKGSRKGSSLKNYYDMVKNI
uniref:Uncharacterized protein n=1 Tax=viral metagenome TaxID=1070528 RepID=A0A6C0LYM8_9ZZZZ